ncbi:uncharacterized protein LOC135931779 isoform X2 [Gordionus sp. m RMFG-2023]|uniref:uncharacterized protein LOC135931779 isoform X2 n=1 Tax=Gordionus sp. m RMFG-2023 TaxID=3053472 RepID=UPI0031FDEA08
MDLYMFAIINGMIIKSFKIIQFYELIIDHLQHNYGHSDYSYVWKNIVKLLDMNKDKIYSADEVNTLYSLIMVPDFLYRLLFWDATYLPQVLGACGSVYSLKYPGHNFKVTRFTKWKIRASLAQNLIAFSIDFLYRSPYSSDFSPILGIYRFDPNLQFRVTDDYQTKIMFPSEILTPFRISNRLHNLPINISNSSFFRICPVLIDHLNLFDNYPDVLFENQSISESKALKDIMRKMKNECHFMVMNKASFIDAEFHDIVITSLFSQFNALLWRSLKIHRHPITFAKPGEWALDKWIKAFKIIEEWKLLIDPPYSSMDSKDSYMIQRYVEEAWFL